MSKLFILVGIPGCGKSTWANRVLSHTNLRVHSSDRIRQELHPGVPYDPEHNDRVFAIFHDRITDSLLDHFDVVADATSLTKSSRGILKAIADQTGSEAHLIFFTNLNQGVLRNLKRMGIDQVPPDAMVAMLEKYERTLSALPQEEYASITYIEAVS